MKLFENKRTQSKRELYICGIRILSKERGSAAAARKNREKLQTHYRIMEQISPYVATNIELPAPDKEQPENIVWQLWLQGAENAPRLVQRCLKSVQQYTQGQPYVLLTEKNLQEYVNIPGFIMEKYKKGCFSRTHMSDIIRLLLLEQHGGTWIDATVLLTSPVPEQVRQAPFFVFKTTDYCLYPHVPGTPEVMLNLQPTDNPYHCCSSWFMHARAHHPLIRKVLSSLLAYWEKEDHLLQYFLLHYFITHCIISDADSRVSFEASPTISNHCPHILQSSLDSPFDETTFAEIKRMSFAHKLTSRHDDSMFSEGSYYKKLLTL